MRQRATIFILISLFLLFSPLLKAQVGPAGVGDFSKTQLWLKSDVGVFTIGINQVVIWQDQSGHGRNFSVVVSGQQIPILSSSMINGFPSIVFNDNGGVNGQFLGYDGPLGFSGGEGATVFLVAKNTTAADEINGGLYIGEKNVGGSQSLRNYGIEHNAAVRFNGSNQIYNDGHSLNDWKVLSYQNQDASQAQNYSSYLDGTLLTGSAAFTNVPTTVATFALIGATQYGGTFDAAGYLDGEISEVIVYTDELTEAERRVIENHLSAKYNISTANDFYSHQANHYYDVTGFAAASTTQFTTPYSGSILYMDSPTDLVDDEYLFFGHQNSAISSWADTEVPVTGMKRLAREWIFDETGDVGTVTVNIPRASLPTIPVGYTNAGVLVDSDGDGDFSTGSPVHYLMTESAGVFSADIDFNDDDQLAIVIFDPLVGFTLASSSVTEDAGSLNIEVSLSYPVGSDLDVDFAVTGGTAANPADYTLVDATLTIPGGTTSASITATIIDDGVPESDETILITLSNPTAGTLGTDLHTATINDNDGAYLASFSAASSNALESVTAVTIPVVLDVVNSSGGDLTVDFEVTGGTATNGSDYSLADGTLIFPNGSNSANIAFTVTNDGQYEADEDIIISLTGTGSVQIGIGLISEHTYTILNDDILPDVLFASATGSGAESFQQASLLVILTQAIGVDVTVDYDVTAGTAAAGSDFVASSGQLTIPAGSTLDTLKFVIIDDGITESNETVIITISNPVNAALGATNQNTYTIFDDDGIGWEGPGGITNFVQNKLWYNAELTTLADNSNVSLWEDLSGNNHDAVQGTVSRQPLFQEDVWNSRPIVNFDGGDGLQVPDNADVNSGGPYDKKTLNVVFRTGVDVTTRQVLYEEGGTVRGLVMYIDAGTLYVAGWNYQNDDGGLTTPWPFISVSTPITANTPYLAGMEFNFDGVSGIGNVVGYLNGDSIGILPGAGRLFAHVGDIGLGWEKNDTYFHDGADGGDGFYFNGFIGEYINSLYIYNLAQKNILNNYYSSKWQIPITNDLFGYDATHSWEVFGIGRHDIDNSHTISQGTGYVKIENPSSLDDDDYLLIGHDNAALTWTATGVPNGDPNLRMLNRTWRSDETTTGDGVGTIKFSVDVNNFEVSPAGFSKYVLITDTDTDFSSGAVTSELVYDAGNDVYYADNVDLGGDMVLTIGIVQPAIDWTLTTGSGLEDITPINVEARLNFIPSTNITADITIGGSATDGSDFTVGSAQVLIPSGQQTATVQLAIIDDSTPELDETVSMSLDNPSGGVIIGTNNLYTYTIQDNDDAYEVQFSLASFTNPETVPGYSIAVELDIAHPGLPVFVDYSISGGTATDPDDFSLASGTLTIPSLSTSGTIPFTIVNDGLFETDETIIVTLSNPINANLGPQNNFTYTITDNETPVGVNFDFASYGGVESFSPANLLITLTGASSSDVRVYYSAFGGTANNIYAGDNDYVILNGSFHTVTPGITQDTINFLVFDDAVLEAGIETIDIRIDSVHGGVVGSLLTQCTYSLVDDDALGYFGPGGVGDDGDYMTWLRSDYITIADGTSLQRWEDASINDDDAYENVVTRRPIFNSVANINGQPYVDFDGSNDYFLFADDPDLNNGGPYNSKTIVLSFRTSADVTSRQMIYQQGIQTRGLDMYIFNGSLYMGGYNLSNSGPGTPWGYVYHSTAIAANTIYNVYFELNYDQGSGTSYLDAYVNGNPIGSSPAGPLYGSGGNVYLGRRSGDMVYHDGTSPNNNADYFSGDIMEFLSFNEILNTPQRILIDNYLATKLGFDSFYDHYDYEIGYSYEPFGIGIENNETHVIAKGSGIIKFDQPTLVNNGNYIISGHDNGDITSWSVNLVNGVGAHFARQWRVDESGEFGNTRVSVDSTILPNKTATFNKWVIMVDTDGDGDFDTGTIDYYELNGVDGVNIFNQSLNLEPGDIYTIGIARNVSAQTGNWSDPNSWTINVPTSSEDAIILNGHTITLDVDASIINLDINAGGELELSSNQLQLEGTINNSGTFTSQTGTILFNSDIAQSIPALTYYNLFFAGTGLKTFAGNIDANNDFSISEVGTTVNSGANDLIVGGDWFNRGSFVELSGSVEFDGSGTFQLWRQDGLNEDFYDLTVSAGANLASNVNISVVSTLTMSGGAIDMNGNVMLLGVNDAQPGTLVYNSGWIIGRFGDWITDSQDGVDLIFPVGVSGFSRKLSFNFADVSTSGYVYSEFDESTPVTNGLPIDENGYIINQLFGEGYWSMLKDGIFDFTGTFNLSIVPAGMTSYSLDADTRTVSRFTASDWFFNGDHVAGGPALLQRDNLTQFVYEYAVGYSETCVATIDNCPLDIAVNNDVGDCQAIVTWTAPTIGGACSGFTLSSTYNSGDAFPIGTTEVKYYLMNGAVKDDSCSFNIIVTDNEDPIVICQDISVVLDATGNASIVAADIDNGSTDNCGIASMTLDQSSFTCGDQGIVPVTLTVTDVNGNSDNCVANVTVNSSLSISSAAVQTCNAVPGVAALFESVVVGGDGNYTYLWDGLEDASDHFMTITLFPPAINTSNTSTDENPLLSWFLADGTYNVRLYVTDGNGCIDSTDINFTKTGLTTENISVFYADECEGSTLTYTRGAYDATATYDWTAENGTILSAITDTNEVDVLWDIGVTEGVLTTTITQPGLFGDCESSMIDSLTIHPIPTPAFVAPVVAVCSGQTETYTLSSSYASYSWTWTNGTRTAGGTATDDFITILWGTTSPGNVDVDVTTTWGCTANTDVDVIIYDVAGTISSQTNESCAGNTDGSVTVTATAGSGLAPYEYSIDGGTNYYASGTFGTLTSGVYNVIIKDALACTFNVPVTIIVEDLVDPVAICQDITIQLSAGGGATITAADIDNGSNDACGIATLSLDKTAFSCADVGANTVTLTVTDVNGRTSTCTATVTVEDNIAPVLAACPVDFSQVNDAASCDAVVSWVEPTASDNCTAAGALVWAKSHLPGDTFPVGTTTVTYTATDAAGNTSAVCTFDITVTDSEAPVLAACPVDFSQVNDAASCDAVVSWVEPTATDNCTAAGALVWAKSHLPGDTFPVGTTTVTYTATDAAGNTSAVCTFDITVTDSEAPVLAACPVDFSQVNDAASCDAVVSWVEPTATDNCTAAGALVWAKSHLPGDTFPVGTTTVTYTATDAAGNTSAVCTFDITVTDSEAPVLAACPVDFSQVNDAASCDAVVSWVEPTATDNCTAAGALVWAKSHLPGDTFPVGTTTVTYTATDAAGNTSAVCTFDITVTDSEAPVLAACPVDFSQVNDAASCDAVVSWVEPTASDNCTAAGALVWAKSHLPGDTFPVGTTTVTYTATDAAGNTSAVCTFDITVTDSEAPVLAACPVDFSQVNDAASCDAVVSWVEPTATDNCTAAGALVWAKSHLPGDTFPVGTSTVTYTATDAAGNTSAVCTFDITVTDSEAPVLAACPVDFSQVNDAASCDAVVSWVEPTASDNCTAAGALVWAKSHLPGDTFPVGTTTVTYTATDAAGNTSAVCTFDITVTDSEAPVLAACPVDFSQVNDAASCDAVVSWVEPTASDNCTAAGALVWAKSHLPGDTFPVGTTTVTYTATDAAGNTSAVCTFDITVTDSEAPVLTACPVDFSQVNDAASCDAVVSWVEPTATDNCTAAGALVWAKSHLPGDTFPVGTTTVTYTATDAAGNTSAVCTFDITVTDSEAPVLAACPVDFSQVNDAASCDAVVSWVEPTATDNCTAAGALVWAKSHLPGDTFPVGTTTVTYTATDAAGNTSAVCTFDITVTDSEAPVLAACPVDFSQVNDAASCDAVVSWVEPTATDNCTAAGALVWAKSHLPGDTFPVGTTTVTYTATDAAGNTSAVCTFDITVTDSEAPVLAACPVDFSQVNDAASCDAVVSWVEPTATDNCTAAGALVWAKSHLPGDTFPVGTTTVTYTATDAAGNTSAVCTFDITVTDSEAPVLAACPVDFSQVNDAASCDAVVSWVEPTATDNCTAAGALVWAKSHLPGDTFPVGTTTVTYTATDAAGNTSAVCTFDITVTDSEAPVLAACPVDFSQVNDAASCDAVVSWVEPTASDNCTAAGALVWAKSHLPGDTFLVGTTTVTYTATDAAGNTSAVCTFDITVTDSEAPVLAACPVDFSQVNDAASCDAVVSWVEPTATDNCTAAGALVWAKSHLPGDTFPVGTTTVTYTATDAAGNTSAVCTFDITVTDSEAPVLAACPVDFSQVNDAASCDAVVSWVEPTASDNCTAAGALVWAKSHLPGDTFPVGTTTVTYTATDAAGNTSAVCTFDITVTDSEAPVLAACPVDFSQVNDAASCDAVVSWVEPTATDNCTAAGALVWAKSHLPGDTFPVGTTTVTYTATDAAGNTSAVCTFDITVTDSEAPVLAACPVDFSQVNDAASCDAVVSWVEPTATDNCTAAGALVWAKSHLPGDTFPVGTTTVTYTATDAAGNTSAVCTFDITVTDSEAPVLAACPVDFSQVNDAASCDAVVSWVEPTASDNCTAAGALVWAKSHLPGDTFPVGTSTVTYTATDAAGNTSAVCTFDITVTDSEAPVLAACPVDFSQVNDAASCDAVVSWVEPTATDNCTAAGALVWAKSHLPGDTFPVGTTTVTYTATDAAGNTSAVCTFDITVTDSEAPVLAACPVDFSQVNDAASCDAVVSWVEPTATDNCTAAGALVWAKSHLPGDTFPVGTSTVTYTATDAAGNTSAVCTFDITVTDSEAPVLAACPVDFSQVNDAASCDAVVSWVEPTATDNCTAAGALVWAKSHLPGDTFPVGTTTVTYTATDAAGNTSAVCTFDITVTDSEAPVLAACPVDFSQVNDAASCDAVVSWVEPTATDNCTAAGALVWAKSHLPGDTFPVGTSTVTYTATDAAGNTSAVCTFDITVTDSEAPVLAACPVDFSQVNDAASCDAVVSWVEPTATDNCTAAGALVWAKSHLPGDTFLVGTTTVTYTATDAAGNTSAVCTFDITVTDSEAPVLTACPVDFSQVNDAASCDAVVSWVEPTATDNCTAAGALVWAKSHLPGDTFPVGTTTVTYTATDAAGNTSAVCTFDITVTDSEAPVLAACPVDFSQVNDAASCDAVVSWVEPTASDNCTAAGALVWAKSHLPGDTFPVGTTTVTYTATDAAGNTSAVCTFDITVTDSEAPVLAACPVDFSQVNDAASCDAVVSWVEPTATDNCTAAGALVWAKSHLPGDTFPVGTTTVTYTATDAAGNTSAVCTFDITVTDSEAPIALCQDITIQLDASGNVSIVPADIDNGSTDNCGIASITLDVLAFDCSDVGINPVTLTVTDINGNSSNCSANVTVEDNVNPIAICQDITVQVDGSCNVSIVAADIDGGSTDACGIASLSASQAVFTCADLGPNNVTLTVTDNNGNVSTCIAVVTVVDNTAPVAICQDLTIALDASGNATITAAEVDNGSFDADGISSLVIDISTFDCSDIGPNTVTLTVTDNNSNTSTCTSTVTIIDNLIPIANEAPGAFDVTIECSDAAALATALTQEPTYTDNCSLPANIIISLQSDNTTVDASCVNEYVRLRTWTAVDENGNTSIVYTQTITAEDTTLPTLIAPPPINRECIADVPVPYTNLLQWIAATGTASDNCGLDNTSFTFIIEIDDGNDCPKLLTRTYGIMDNCGNLTTVTQDIIINDVTAPVLTPPIQLDIECSALIPVPYVSLPEFEFEGGTAVDNCGIDAASFTHIGDVDDGLFNPKTITRTYEVADNCGLASQVDQLIVIDDTSIPVISGCPSDQVLPMDAGVCGAVATWILPSALDNCDGVIALIRTDGTGLNSGDVFPAGTTTIIYTATDTEGNISTCSFDITVNPDSELPILAACPVDFSQVNDAASCDAVVSWVEPTATDNCTAAGALVWAKSHLPGDTFPVGTTTVTYTATDAAGNTSAVCTFDITVTDSEAPVLAACPVDFSQVNDAASCDAVVSWVEPTATDNCTAAGALVWAKSHLPGDTFPVGTTTVTYTATDAAGNTSAVCTFDITVTDSEAPVLAACPVDFSQVNDAASCDAVVSWVEPTATDNCTAAGALVWAKSHLPGDTFPVGTTTVTYTATDAAGNTSAVCTFDITVTDSEAPVLAACPVDFSQVNDAASCDAVVSWVEPTATDNCTAAGALVWAKSHLPGDTFPVGTTTVTYTATDAAGNTSAVCTFDITVTDSEAPVLAACPVDFSQVNDAASCDAVVSWVEPTASDNCTAAGALVWAKSHLPGDTFPVGTTTVTYTATDAAGNTSAVCTFDITVTDSEAPVLAACPVDFSQVNDAASCDAVVSWVEPTATDNCTAAGALVWAKSHLPGDTFPVGTTTVTYTATDAAGNTSAVCTFDITVTDSEAPVLAACPVDFSQVNDAASCDAVVSWVEPTASDNCTAAGALVWAKSHLPGDTFPVGTTTVTYTATDAAGNTSAVCTFDITVTDSEAPVLAACPVDFSQVNDAASCDAVVSWVEPTATDNCTAAGALVWAKSHLPGDTFPVGTSTVTYTATDAAGNTSAVCTFDITVTDSEAPVLAACPVDFSQVNDAASCDAVVSWVEPTATDNCTAAGALVWAKSHLPGDTFPVGTSTVTYTATDAAGNTSAVCTFDITVTDSEAPVLAACPVDFSQVNDAASCDAVVSWLEPTATDNCTAAGALVWAKSHLPGDTFPVGTTTVTYTATDAAGNTSAVCTFDITVTDSEAPVLAACPVDFSQVNDAASCDAVVSWVEPTATDNCTAAGALVWAKSHLPGDTFPVGTSTVTYTATDAAGNTSAVCTFDITVTDSEAPVLAACPVDFSQVNDAASCDAVVSWVEPTASDNCTAAGALVWAKSHLPGDTFPVGTTTVTYTATDAAGNTSAVCTFDITVTDSEAPVLAACPADQDPVVMDVGICGATINWVDPTANDNCDGAVAVVRTDATGLNTGDIFPEGITTISYSATDAQGNISTCSFIVNIPDTELPVATCVGDQAKDTNPGVCGYTVAGIEFDATATDNCTVASLTNDYNGLSTLAGEIIPTGVTTIIWTTIDAVGNIGTCEFDITVTDAEDPILVTIDTTVAIGAGGIVTIDSSYVYVAASSSDNCGIISVTVDKVLFDCLDLGPNTVNITAMDAAGNITSGTAVVTVIDTNVVTADAGVDEAICITDGGVTITTAAVTNGTVLWGTMGDGTFNDPSLVNPIYTLGLTDAASVKLYMDVTAIAGCNTDVDTMMITIYDAPTVDAGSDIDLCGAPLDVSITGASSTNGTNLWTSDGDGTFDDNTAIDPIYTFGPSDIGPVTLTLTVTGPGTCGSIADDLIINFIAAPSADAGADDTVCGSLPDYSVTGASSSGGTILWTTSGDGTFDDDAIILPVYTFGAGDVTAGNVTLTLTVTGGGTCGDATDDKLITLNETPGISVIEHTDITCNSLSDGIIRIDGTGGTPPYTFSIDGGLYGASGDFTGLGAASYLFSVMDAVGCTKDTTITIIEPVVFTAALGVTVHNSCFQSNDASIAVTVSGGTLPYVASWTGPNGFTSTDIDISSLEAGDYTLNIDDANGCMPLVFNVTINEPPQIVITAVSESDFNGYGVSCNGSADGFIEVDVTGGTGLLTISWAGPNGFTSSDEDIIDLEAGNYILTVTDALTCSETYDVTITEPLPLQIDFVVTDANCPGDNAGAIDLVISGGVGPYTFLWDDAETTEDRTGIPDGTYTVDVTDLNSCTEQAIITVDLLGVNCVQIPEIITPNGDGRNDVLIIDYIDLYPNALIRIFNRWGKLIFSGEDLINNRWDGTFKGKLLPVDSYHYILDLKDGSKPLTGTITIIK